MLFHFNFIQALPLYYDRRQTDYTARQSQSQDESKDSYKQ